MNKFKKLKKSWKKSSCTFSFLILFASSCFSYAQGSQKIKFAKDNSLVYFFQVDEKSDTISKNIADRFYFIVPDSLKSSTIISVDNGRLIQTKNDSILQFNYLPGLRYESLFLKKDFNALKEIPSKQFDFKTQVNGPCNLEKTKILIQVIDRKSDNILIENVYWWR